MDALRRRTAWALLLALLALLGLAAAPAGADGLIAARVMLPAPLEVAPGGSDTVRIEVQVRPGFHVQANPVLDPSLIPITLTLQGQPGVGVGRAVYPHAKRFRLSGATDELVVYDGRFHIQAPITVARQAPAGRLQLRGSLRYQACDDRTCLPPRTVPVLVPVHVVQHTTTLPTPQRRAP